MSIPLSTRSLPPFTAPAFLASAGFGFWRKSVTRPEESATYTPCLDASAIVSRQAMPVTPAPAPPPISSIVTTQSPLTITTCPPPSYGSLSASEAIMSNIATGFPSADSHGIGANALPIAEYAGVRRESPPE